MTLSDETRVVNNPWGSLKEMAMKNDLHEQGWYKNLVLKDRDVVERLVDAQKAQGNMDPLQPVMCSIGFEDLVGRASGGKPPTDSKSSVVTLSDITVIDGRPWSKLKIQAMEDDKVPEGIETAQWYQKLSAEEKELVGQLVKAQKAQGNMQELKPVKYIISSAFENKRENSPELIARKPS